MKKTSSATDSWFTFRSLYRTRVFGRAKRKGRLYDANIEAIEERFVLISAANLSAAKKKAEREAQNYVDTHNDMNLVNYFGERIQIEFLGWSSYEMYDPPASGAEVYSRTKAISAKTANKKIIQEYSYKKPSDKMIRFISTDIAEDLLNQATRNKSGK